MSGHLQRARQVFFPIAVNAHLRQHAAKLSLQYGHGRLQLVRGGGKEGEALAFQLALMLNIAAQRGVGALQLGHCAGQIVRQQVQAFAQRADLIPAPRLPAGAEIQRGDAAGDAADLRHGPRDQPRMEECGQQRQSRDGQQQPGHHALHGLYTLIHSAQSAANGQLRARAVGKAQLAHAFHIGAVGECDLLNGVGTGRCLRRARIGLLCGGFCGHIADVVAFLDGRCGIAYFRGGIGEGIVQHAPARVDQAGFRARLTLEFCQYAIAGLGERRRKPVDQRVRLLRELAFQQRAVTDGRKIGDCAAAYQANCDQQRGGHCEYAQRQAGSKSCPHDSPPPARYECSRRRSCGADS